MKHLISTMTAALILVIFCSPGLAQTNKEKKTWDVIFASDLAKITTPKKTDGLGYSLTEDEALEQAVKSAVGNGAPACEAAKMAVSLNFNPYSVLMGVFKSGGKVKLDELCMCATETGGDNSIAKGIMKQAADDALAENLITRDEISQAQCLDQGLAFTTVQTPFERNDPNKKKPKYSPY